MGSKISAYFGVLTSFQYTFQTELAVSFREHRPVAETFEQRHGPSVEMERNSSLSLRFDVQMV